MGCYSNKVDIKCLGDEGEGARDSEIALNHFQLVVLGNQLDVEWTCVCVLYVCVCACMCAWRAEISPLVPVYATHLYRAAAATITSLSDGPSTYLILRGP